MAADGGLTDSGRVALLVLMVGEASGVFAGFCPSWFTVSSEFFNEGKARAGNVKRIRQGEAAATAIVMATGLAVARSGGGPWAIWASAGICAVFIGGYEYAIAHPSRSDGADTAGPVLHTLGRPGFQA